MSAGMHAVLGNYEKCYPETDHFAWRDITTQITVRGTGPTDPPWSQIGSGPFWAYKFGVNDQCWMAFHIPHDIVPAADIHFHTHWIPDGVATEVVKWQFTYAYAKGFNQGAMDMAAGEVVTAEQAGPGVAYTHMVTETAAVNIPGLTEPDGIVYVNVQRVTNGGSDNADDIFLLTSDIHYQSTNLGTYDKAPNFYG